MNTKLFSLVIWGLFLVLCVNLACCDDSTSRAINLSMAWRPVHFTPIQAVQAAQQSAPKPQVATQFISIPTLAKANTAQLLQIAHYNAQVLNAKMKDLQAQYSTNHQYSTNPQHNNQQYSANQQYQQYRNPFAIFGANASSPKFRAALLNDLKPFSPKYTVTTSGVSPVVANGYKAPIYLSEIDHHLPLVHSSTQKIPSVVPSVNMSPTITHYSYIPLLQASPSSLIFRDTPVVMPQSATFQGKTTLKPHPVLNKLQAHLALATNHKQPYASYSNILEKLTVPVLAPNVFKNHVLASHFIKQTKNVTPVVSKIINNTVPKAVVKPLEEQPKASPSEVPPPKSVEAGVRSRNENRTRITIFEEGPFTPIVRENAVVKEAKPTLKSSDVLNELNRHRNIIQIMEGLPQIPSSVSSVDISGEQNFRPIEILKKYNISKSPLQDLNRFAFQSNSFMDFTSPSRKYPILPTIPTTMMSPGDKLSSSHFRLNEIKEPSATVYTPFLPTPNSYGHHLRKPQFSGSHTFFTIEDAVTGTAPTRNTIDFKDLFDTTTEIIKPVREDTTDVTTIGPEPHTHFYKFMKYPSSSSTVTIYETTTQRSKLKQRRRKPGHRYKSNINDPNWIDKFPKESVRESVKAERNVTAGPDVTSTTRLSARFRQRTRTDTTTTTTESPEIPTTSVTEISDQVAPTTDEAINSTATAASTTPAVVQINSSTLKPMAKYNSISRPRLSLKNSSYYLNNLSTTTTTNQPSEIVTTPKFTRKRFPTRPSTTTTDSGEDNTLSTESSTSTTTSTSKRFHPTRNNTFTRPSFTKPSTEGPASRGSTAFSTRRGSSRIDFRNQKSTSPSSTTELESSTRSSTQNHRRFQAAQDKMFTTKQRHRVEETSSPESIKVDTTTEHKLETSIMKIAKNDHSYRPYAHQTSKTTESLINTNLINDISTEKSAKSVNTNSKNRRIPEYFTIATDDPILPIQAFFPKFD
ncbi:mucin-3B-like [Phlebotomus argentipes]|uniref:mucin-3B-like n=1 Tax=Phlebotomus argentipes TaxID=94469 RepID=UPI00289371B0|nr:mucin-3B-like [Phlebotomus argentipes]